MLAVVFGVLTMHGQANAQHHAPAAPSASAHLVADAAHAAHAAPATTSDCDGECSTDAHGLMALCVAVLVAAFAALILTQAGRRPLLLSLRGPPAPLLPGRTAVPRPRDATTELCISRT